MFDNNFSPVCDDNALRTRHNMAYTRGHYTTKCCNNVAVPLFVSLYRKKITGVQKCICRGTILLASHRLSAMSDLEQGVANEAHSSDRIRRPIYVLVLRVHSP